MRIPTLQASLPIVDSSGCPTPAFVQWWGNSLSQVVKTAADVGKILTLSLAKYAVGDGVTDDTAAVQAAIDTAYAAGGGQIDCSGGRWLIDSADLIVKQGVSLVGPWLRLGETDNWDYSTLKGSFVLNSLYTIRLAQEFSGIRGCGIFRKGLTRPTDLATAGTVVSAYAGTAITVGYGVSKDASDTYAGHCLILGFQYAYYNDYNERPLIEYLNFDCTNGIYLNRIYDMNQLVGCHGWNYVTAHQSWSLTGDAGWRRQGTAYTFGTGVDWGQAERCFSYGYDTGFDINGSDNVVLVNCGADGYKDNNTYSKGYYARGTTKNLNLIGCKASSKYRSLYVDLSGGGDAAAVKMVGGNLNAASTGTGVHAYVNGGAVSLQGVSLFDGPTGVQTTSTAGVVTVRGCVFQTIGAAFTFSNVSLANVGANTFVNSADTTTGERQLIDGTFHETARAVYNASSSGSTWVGRHARGTAASPTIIQSNDILVSYRGDGWDGANWQSSAQLRAQVQGTPAAGDVAGAWIFSTRPAAGALTDRWIFQGTGHYEPLADNAYNLGSASNRAANVYAVTATFTTATATTVNATTLTVAGSGADPAYFQRSDATANPPNVTLRKSRGSSGTPTLVSGGDILGRVNYRGYDGTNWLDGATITVTSSGTPGTNVMAAKIVFATNAGAASATDRMTISETGNVYAASGGTTMSDGFFYIPSAAGAPTGVPTAVSGRVPMYFDSTGNNFYIYNGAWKKVLLT